MLGPEVALSGGNHGGTMPRSLPAPLHPLRDFLRTESASGVLLVGASIVALAWANLDAASYEALWTWPLAIGVDGFLLNLDLRHWINDAAMALFFFVVGLEIKRELVDGELRGPRRAALPALAAAGGMVMPALIYLTFNSDGPNARGWGIPMATDIAFAVGVLALTGSRVPVSLKVFLLSVAIVDDIGAIAVIAVFYSSGIATHWLAFGALALLGFALGWRLSATWWRAGLLGLLAALAWLFIHASGVHATIAGVFLGLVVPATASQPNTASERLAHGLHPWTGFLIVPLFALGNAGVQLAGETVADALASPVALGVMLGLLVGKFVGIAGTVFLATRLRVVTLPEEVTGGHVLGVAALGGIGFTVSLFITQLAFTDAATAASAKLAIFAASVVAGVVGFGLLRIADAGHATLRATVATTDDE